MTASKWGDVRPGDLVRDALGRDWEVLPDGFASNEHGVIATIAWRDRRASVTKDPAEEVEVAPRQGTVEAATAIVEKTLGPVEVIADGDPHSGATVAEPARLPAIESPLELRSHCYLLHGLYVGDVPESHEAGPMLRELHRQAHETGPMSSPHTHQEAK